ncbi:hypothetical protein TRIP_C20389 [Candidatus Zixiibacteriota bacterium]|nr:hypothetical protein TRIP_C20389 [candidate division Zixibacteria bacterium]
MHTELIAKLYGARFNRGHYYMNDFSFVGQAYLGKG